MHLYNGDLLDIDLLMQFKKINLKVTDFNESSNTGFKFDFTWKLVDIL